MNKRYKQICYLCGKKLSRGSSNRTVDHIPPRGFFPENFDRKANLPTVLCCRKCNNSYARLDEEFRFLLSSGNHRSKAGDWIWNNKAEPKIGESLVNFCANLVRGFGGYETLQMGDSLSQVVNTTVSYTEKILPFFSRLAKGFLVYDSHNYKNYDFVVFPLYNYPEMYKVMMKYPAKRLFSDDDGEHIFSYVYQHDQEFDKGFFFFSFYKDQHFGVLFERSIYTSASEEKILDDIVKKWSVY